MTGWCRSTCLAWCWLAWAWSDPMGLQAGLHYSGERIAELPSEWRGLLGDLRWLRSVAVPATPQQPASSLKAQYLEAAARLQAWRKERTLTQDELADLGAILLRLGQIDAATALLQQAQRDHPRHFAITANLACAWQMTGDLNLALENLRLAVDLAPNPKLKEMEQWHLRWVRQRLNRPRQDMSLDDLFGTAWVDEQGRYRMGRLPDAERNKLPANALAIVQQLLIWFPSDGRLVWQMGEIAAAYGDRRGAADLLDVAVGEFAIHHPDLRSRRNAFMAERAAPPAAVMGASDLKAQHALHGSGIAFKSKRPLIMQRLDTKSLGPIRKQGINDLPWLLLMETVLDRHFKPTFPAYLKELDGLKVEIIGYLQPITDDVEAGVFLLVEFPAGCWFCEMPDPTAILLIEMPDDQTAPLSREAVKVTGILSLNSTDPENFLFTIKQASIGPPS